MARTTADQAKINCKASYRALSKSRKGSKAGKASKAGMDAAKREPARDDDPSTLTPEEEVLLLHVME